MSSRCAATLRCVQLRFSALSEVAVVGKDGARDVSNWWEMEAPEEEESEEEREVWRMDDMGLSTRIQSTKTKSNKGEGTEKSGDEDDITRELCRMSPVFAQVARFTGLDAEARRALVTAGRRWGVDVLAERVPAPQQQLMAQRWVQSPALHSVTSRALLHRLCRTSSDSQSEETGRASRTSRSRYASECPRNLEQRGTFPRRFGWCQSPAAAGRRPSNRHSASLDTPPTTSCAEQVATGWSASVDSRNQQLLANAQSVGCRLETAIVPRPWVSAQCDNIINAVLQATRRLL